jgi:HSP20 family molecular chaperone IbpA
MKDYEITQNEKSTEIKFTIPGVDRQDIKIEVAESKDIDGFSPYAIYYNSYPYIYPYKIYVSCEKLGLDYNVGVETNQNISAKLDKGILTISVPYKQPNKRQIQIN